MIARLTARNAGKIPDTASSKFDLEISLPPL
jgi:hypothetical protein